MEIKGFRRTALVIAAFVGFVAGQVAVLSWLLAPLKPVAAHHWPGWPQLAPTAGCQPLAAPLSSDHAH
jgi:hypothetical protein